MALSSLFNRYFQIDIPWHPAPGGEEAIAQAPVPSWCSGAPTVPPGRHDVAGTALLTIQDTKSDTKSVVKVCWSGKEH